MRISDWSSDVCSSDLVTIGALPVGELAPVLHEPVSAHRRVGAHLGFQHHRSNGVHGAPFGGGVDQAVVAIERAAHIARGIGLDDIERLRSDEHKSELQSLMRISYAVY